MKNSKDVLNLITPISSDTQEVHLGEENTITTAEVLLTFKSLKLKKAAMESSLKCSKPWTVMDFFCLLV